MIYPTTLTPMDRPETFPTLVEAEGEVLRLFDAWFQAANDDRARTLDELVTAMWSHRNVWFMTNSHIFYLRKNDRVRILPRSEIYPRTKKEATT